jgi:hypothetical protein
VKRGGFLSLLTILTFAVPELLDLIKIVKNERDPPLFTGKLLIKFQNILRNTTQVIIWHRVKILFSVISSPITLERQKWKSSKMKWILLSVWNFISSLLVKRGGSLSFSTIFTFVVSELLDLIWRKIGFSPYVVW